MGWMDQVFTVKMFEEKYIAQKKQDCAIIFAEKRWYNIVNRKVLCEAKNSWHDNEVLSTDRKQKLQQKVNESHLIHEKVEWNCK